MTANSRRVLLTGGTGRLGREIIPLLANVVAPHRGEMDITRMYEVEAAIEKFEPDVIVHAAAYTDVLGAERDRDTCWRVNVLGARNVAQAAMRHGIDLIHISTDYVFEGTRGLYSEDDTPGPVCNYYALTKLVAEELVRMVPKHLVIRTSFRAREWPHPVAYADMYTSQDYVDVIAPKIALAIARYRDITYSTLHIATERKSMYELARRRKPDVSPGTRTSSSVNLPRDVSLDISRWKELQREWGVECQ